MRSSGSRTPSDDEIHVRIVAPHFVAGAVILGEEIILIAPILRAALRRRGLVGRAGLRELVRVTKWKAEIVPPYVVPSESTGR